MQKQSFRYNVFRNYFLSKKLKGVPCTRAGTMFANFGIIARWLIAQINDQ